MIQYHRNIPLVYETRKATVENIFKQLEYVTKGHSNVYSIVLNLKH